MKKLFIIKIFLLLSITFTFSCGSVLNSNINNLNQPNQMKSIKFIPEEFNNIKLGYNETEQSVSSLQFPDGIPINTITISTPDKIVCNLKYEDFTPVIPVCAVYLVSLKRGLKYNDLSAMMLHIRKLDEKAVHSGEIVDKGLGDDHPILPPGHLEDEKQRLAMVEEAQGYSDEELDLPGLFEGNFLNINLIEYIDIPLKSGKYEIYLSFSGLESNRTIVEVLCK